MLGTNEVLNLPVAVIVSEDALPKVTSLFRPTLPVNVDIPATVRFPPCGAIFEILILLNVAAAPTFI